MASERIMQERTDLIADELDRDMEEIEDLYSHMLVDGSVRDGKRDTNRGEKGDEKKYDIHPEIKSRLHKKILTEIESLRESQRNTEFGSKDYWEIDYRIRRRVLKEIQIIIDAYVIALNESNLSEWECMYGDIAHYKRDFFYFRMDPDYENHQKILHDYKIIEE